MAVQTGARPVSGTRPEAFEVFRVVSLPHFQGDHWWYISRWSGSLLRSDYRPPLAIGSPSQRVRNALAVCENPFKCRWSSRHESPREGSFDEVRLTQMNRRFFQLGNRRFLASILYAGWSVNVFSNTRLAFSVVSQLPGHKDSPSDRCFQRSLLVAKSSESFRHSGVVFIGAEFSTGEMHAWIIEDGEQPDPDDRTWINYRPLLAIHG
jgi:hypothetical protein